MVELEKIELNDKELVFAESYLIHLNKAQAARDSGCPAKSARVQGYEIYNRIHVKAYIEARLSERVQTAEETVKQISDIARANLTDYYVPVKVVRSKKKKVPLQTIINDLREKIDFEDEFALEVSFDEEELKEHEAKQKRRKREVIRLKLELKKNPKAYRIVNGPDELVEEMQLDVNLLVADKEKGKVKKIKYGRDGLEVEMYSAMEANDKLMKMHGKYEKDNDQSKPQTTNIINLGTGVKPDEAST